MLTSYLADTSSLSSEQEATASVDALVNETDNDNGRRDVSIINPQLLEHRRPTPTIPPGFSAPLPQKSAPPMSRTTTASTITPAVPVVPVMATVPVPPHQSAPSDTASGTASATSVAKAQPLEPKQLNKKASDPKARPTVEKPKAAVDTHAQTEEQSVKPVVSESPAKQSTKSRASSRKVKIPLDKDVEAATTVQSSSGIANVTRNDGKDSRVGKDASVPETPISTPAKRQPPGKLDIAAATATRVSESEKGSMMGSQKADSQQKGSRSASLVAGSSVPASPAAISTGSPVKRTVAPRTIRVVATPKVETPPVLSAGSGTVPQVPTVEKLRSRQASIASITQPGTPVSELISEDASGTSASVSRANTPPPIGGKVGTAPVRKKTKSQAKKERQERARQILEEQVLAIEEPEPEPVQAPIVGRKKKTKKPAASVPKPSAAAKSQPSSPKPAAVEAPAEIESKPNSAPAPASAKSISVQSTEESSTTRPPLEQEAEEQKEKLGQSTQEFIASLQSSGELLTSMLEFFKPLSASLAHSARIAQMGGAMASQDAYLHISEADIAALADRQAVRLGGPDGKPESHTLITPEGKCLWGLTQELEERALELEKHIETLKGFTGFHSVKQHVSARARNGNVLAQPKEMIPVMAKALEDAAKQLKKTPAYSSLDANAPLPDLSVLAASHRLPPQQVSQEIADAAAYLNQFVIPDTDSPPNNNNREETFAVGGRPGADIRHLAVNVENLTRAVKAVAEGGTLDQDLEGTGVTATDLLSSAVLQGLEALIGTSLGFQSNQDLNVDRKGNITLGGRILNIKELVDLVASGIGLGGFGPGHTRRGDIHGRGVLSVHEAEQAMLAAKKEHEALEKKLTTLMKRNRKAVGKA
ncbi:hypothetical protein M011DRAFT_398227 [Sporormia fimetaria CBS 119925]|uniref:Uncharacterized protein n=1 Tax=Sporormia fimetaria CBS 119925 TaxID=1340428 RepID=A0A6A6VJ60_9PLEO|nr:hypothetical protein M011DRAFT_398227 [Sporormia fimetaria CBS 119925]